MIPRRTPSKLHQLPTESQIASVFRALADTYSGERARLSENRAWQRIALQQQLGNRRRNRGFVSWLGLGDGSRVGVPALAAGFALAALLLVAGVGFWPRAEVLSYDLRGGTVDEGWVITQQEPAALRFSDGSVVEVESDSVLSVNVLGERSALTRLSRGKLKVAVQHRPGTNWTFLAGPYEVRVEGTAFDLSVRDEAVSLSMSEGRVRVVGPDRQWVLHAGDAVTLPVQRMTAATKPADKENAVAAVEQLPPAEAEGPVAPDPLRKDAELLGGSAVLSKANEPNWPEMVAAGRFTDVIESARSYGVSRALRGKNAAELSALAQAARYAGETALAEQSWATVRKRFPRSGSAQRGAYFLARLKEQQGQPAEAARWFETYLREAPQGVYAAEALGRQLVLARSMQRTGTAERLASEYLKRFPRGAYANAARATLARE